MRTTRRFNYLFVVFLVGVTSFWVHQYMMFPQYEFAADTYQTDSGWGYKITKNGKIFIKQDCIPAIPGSISFKTKTDAEKTAKLVLERVKSKHNPSISIKDLEFLNIDY